MSRPDIATRLHKLGVMTAGDAIGFPEPRHYVIAPDLFAALGRADVQRSISAMIEADMARLPFPCVLVEFEAEPGVARFVWLREAPGGFDAVTAMLTAKGLATVPIAPAAVAIQGGEIAVREAASAADAAALALGAAFALLMLNIGGVDKVRIDPRALNRARERRGDPPIPTHTVLRIGIVLDRRGRAVKGGGLKTVYLRAGHVRQQAVGKNWAEHKIVYIAPQLVNYREGDAEPQVKPKLVRMR